jgi:subtilisin-like proprotein convertase family protein
VFGQLRWLGAGLLICLASCSVDETTAFEDAGGVGGQGGGSGGSGALGGGTFGGNGGTSASGGSGGNTGGVAGTPAGGTGGVAGTPAGGGGTGGVAGTPAGGGGTGGVVDPCGGNCTDPNATCSDTGSCDCNGNFLNIDTDGNPQTAECKSTLISDVVVADVAIAHEACGNLVIKLRGPDNTLIALMSRPGYTEGADDGTGNNAGDQSGMTDTAPVDFDDAAATSAESMGSGPPGQTVCQATGVCAYHPAQGAAPGPATLAAAFDGKSALGTWRICIGDADNNNNGTFQGWELRITTSDHQFVKSATALNLSIPDNAYNGTQDSGTVACSDITLP